MEMAFGLMDLANDAWLVDMAAPRHPKAPDLHARATTFLHGSLPADGPARERLARLAPEPPEAGRGYADALDRLRDNLRVHDEAGSGAERRAAAGQAKGYVKAGVAPAVREARRLIDLHRGKIARREGELRRGSLIPARADELARQREVVALLDEHVVALEGARDRFRRLPAAAGGESGLERSVSRGLDGANAARRFVSRHRLATLGPVGVALVGATVASMVAQGKKKSKPDA